MKMSLKDNSNKKMFKISMLNKKSLLLLLVSLLVVGIILGVIFFGMMQDTDKITIANNMELLFKNELNDTGYFKNIINSLYNNFIYVTSSFVLGISIIGIVIVLFILFFKGITTGVSIASIFFKYQIGGLLGNLLYLFPDKLLSLLLFIYMSYFSVLFGINLFLYLFLKRDIDLHNHFRNYLKKLYIGLIIAIIISILEVFISPLILNIFTFFIK